MKLILQIQFYEMEEKREQQLMGEGEREVRVCFSKNRICPINFCANQTVNNIDNNNNNNNNISVHPPYNSKSLKWKVWYIPLEA